MGRRESQQPFYIHFAGRRESHHPFYIDFPGGGGGGKPHPFPNTHFTCILHRKTDVEWMLGGSPNKNGCKMAVEIHASPQDGGAN